MKRSTMWVVVVIVIAALAVGVYALYKPVSKTATPSPSPSASSSQSPSTAASNAIVQTKTNSSVGSYLADPNGKTLYTYGGDTSGASNCTGACLTEWPAYVDSGATTG